MAEPSQLWRIPAPTALLLGLGLFALPWIEVTCEVTPSMQKRAAGKGVTLPDGQVVMLSQTGWQAMLGEYTVGEHFRNADAKQEEKTYKPAWMLAGFFGASIAGAVLGLAMPVGSGRRALVGLCIVAAIVPLLQQTWARFPVMVEEAPLARFTLFFHVVWGLLIAGLLAVIVEAYIASAGSGRSSIHRHQFLDS